VLSQKDFGSQMNASTANRLRQIGLAVIAVLLGGFLQGCAFRLPGLTPPSAERLRIMATAPEMYAVHLETHQATDLPVPPDGRLTVTIPSYRATCGVYLFNSIKLKGENDPLRSWSISVKRSGKTVRKLSVRQLRKLPVDSDGYRLVRIRE
jgi:hypothetical protein